MTSFRLRVPRSVAPFLLALASACGGGGGGGGSSATPPTGLVYADAAPTYTACVAAAANVPTFAGTVTSFGVAPPLPPGLVLDATTGEIAGTPSALAAATSHTVTASGPKGTTTFDVVVAVVAPPSPGKLRYPTAYGTELVGVSVALAPTVEGVPSGWSVSPALPAGLALDPMTGVITGAADATAALATYTVTAEDCLGASTSVDLELAVVEPSTLIAPRFLHVPAADGTVGVFGVRGNGQLRANGYDLVGGDPVDAATSWTQRHLLVLSASAPALECYAIDPLHGRLSEAPVASAALPAGSAPLRVLVDELHRVAWVSLSGADAVAAFALGGDGGLAALAGSPYALSGDEPCGLALASDASLLYVANTGSDSVSVLELDGAGVPTSEQASAVGASPRDVAVLAGTGGDLVYVGEDGGDAIGIHAATGPALAPLGGTALAPASAPLTLATAAIGGIPRLYVLADDPTGHLQVFAADATTGALSGPTIADTNGPANDGLPLAFALSRDEGRAFALFGATAELAGMTVDGSGLLAPVQPSTAPTNRMRTRPAPRRFALVHGVAPFERVSDALYTSNRTDADVSQFAFDAVAGQLDALVPPAEPTAPLPTGTAVHPRLDVLYVSDDPQATTSAQPVGVFALDEDGVATALGTYDAGLTSGGFHGLALDPAGRFLAASARLQGELHVMAVGAEGALTAADVGTTATLPLGVAFAPHGAFVYCATNADDQLHGFAVDPATGALTPVPGSPAGTGSAPVGVTVDSSGRFAYVACAGGDVLSAFAIDPADGSMVELSASPFATGLDPQHVVADPTGRFVYVACSGAQAVFGHRVNLDPGNAYDDGTLTVPGSVAVSGPPLHVEFDPSGEHLFVTVTGAASEVVTFTANSITGQITLSDSDPTGAGSRTSTPRVRPR